MPFFVFMRKIGLKNALLNLNQFFYRRYVDDIFALFESTDHLEKFRNYFNTFHPNMSFSLAEEKHGKMSFLDVEILRENSIFVTTVYRKPIFSGVYTHFGSFLPSTHKFGVLYTLVHRCFTLCSDWSKFHGELVTLKEIFQKKWLSDVIYR